MIAAVLSLAQTLVGSQKATLGSGSHTGVTGAGGYTGGTSKARLGTSAGGINGGVSVSIATRTQVESDSAVVQLELADWATETGMEKDHIDEKQGQYANIEL